MVSYLWYLYQTDLEEGKFTNLLKFKKTNNFMKSIQQILLWIYKVIKETGLLENKWVQSIFYQAYFFYKRYFEDGFWGLTQEHPQLFQGGNILDIGANIGYTSTIFSQAITEGFQVYAFEPEEENFISLRKIINLHKRIGKIIPIQAAIGQHQGEIELWYNKDHHADHRILTEEYKKSGVNLLKVSTVPMWSVDSFVELKIANAVVKFIKIDVQGYELQVCLGMEKTLKANPDLVIAIEYSPSSMIELGFIPKELLDFFQAKGYLMYLLTQRGKLKLLENHSISSLIEKSGYIDLLFTKQELS